MHMASAAYGIGKAAKDRMAQDLNKELDGTGRDPQTVRARQNHSLTDSLGRETELRSTSRCVCAVIMALWRSYRND